MADGAKDGIMLSEEDLRNINYIERRMLDFFSLWSDQWDGENYPNYAREHTRRFRETALSIAEECGMDMRLILYGETMHDAARKFVGLTLKDTDGNVIRDGRGRYKTLFRAPERSNVDLGYLYSRVGKITEWGEHDHGSFGAILAGKWLSELGIDTSLAENAIRLVRTHILPMRERLMPEEHALHDADFTDANFGAASYFRKIVVRTKKRGSFEPAVYAQSRVEDLKEFEGKLNYHITTSHGIEMARQRIRFMHSFVERLEQEAESNPKKGGCLFQAIRILAEDYEFPDINKRLISLGKWLSGLNDGDGVEFVTNFYNAMVEENKARIPTLL